MTLALMLNKKAGTKRTARLASYVYQQLNAAGIPYKEVVASSAQDAIAKATALAPEVSGYLAVGGDGSVHTAAQVAWKQNLPLGIIASGSGDDIARACGLPHGRRQEKTRAAVDHFVKAWQAQDISNVDLLQVKLKEGNERAVLAVVSCGFDSRVSVTSQDLLYVRGTTRYVLAMVKTLAKFSPIHYKIEVDDQPKEFKAMMFAVGNGSMFGGGMKVLPAAKINDGKLDTLVVNEMSIPSLLGVFPKIFSGSHVNHPKVNAEQAKQVLLHAEGEQVWGDGEYLGTTPAQICLNPNAIRIVGARL